MKEKTITEFLDNEYKEFALYSIEGRAISSCIDGFKPVQRKVIHVSSQIWKTGSEKTMKIFQLSGKVASDVFYHHGDASLSNAIVNMAQKFKNNAPLLEEDGQFGSLRSPQAGAPRYIGTRLSKYFRLIYKDVDLLEFKEEEGEKIEPKYFLPIIPTILINGGSGIAVGFASNILNRDVISVINECEKYLKGKDPINIPPKLNGFLGTYIQDSENPKKWIIRGNHQVVNTTTIKISELPPSMTYEKYEDILDKLIESKSIISYDDNCKDNIDYTIKMSRSDLSKLSEQDIVKLLKLEESETEIYTTLDEGGKLKIFDSVSEIIKYFVDFRLQFYQKRKDFMIEKIMREIKILQNRGKFIKLILDGKLVINNKAKLEIIGKIEEAGIEKVDGDYEYLLRMPIHSLTKDTFEKLKEEFTQKKSELESIKLLDPKDMYLDDLKELKKNFK
jgi:DNA gyrase/topoisomerase IV subunit A